MGVAFVEQYNLHLKSKVFLRDKLVAICAMIKIGLSVRARVFPWLSVLPNSAGKGPFMAGKAKNMHQRHNFPGAGGGGWSEGHGPALAEKFRS